jgi:hypothetical protein
LDADTCRGAGLEVAYRSSRIIRPLIGVEPEVVKRAVANCIRVLISRKRIRAPSDRGWVGGINIPWRTAIAGVSYCAIMREAGMLRRRMESDVSDIDASSYRHGERLNRTIEVLVIERVLIVPNPGIWSRHFVTDEENAVASRGCPGSRLDLIYNRTICTSPNHNGRLLSHGGADRRKAESGRAAAHSVPLVRSVVVHVALIGMSLAPGAFVRDDVFCFGKIGGARILRRDQVTGLHQNPVRRYVVTVAAVVVGC